MEIKTYFLDTYVFFELIKGNKNYERFIKNINFITTKFNLMELYYGLLVKHGKKIADLHYDLNVGYCVDISDETIKEAMLFRVSNKHKNLSYIDCVGYILSKKLGINFLTGDKKFENLDNVEFVK